VRARLEHFVADTFRPYIGTSFSFRQSQQPDAIVQMTLQEVRAAAAPERAEALASVRRGGFFSLLFVAETDHPPPSGLYQLDHPDFEPSLLLLSRVSAPWRRPQDPPLLEAVFG